MRRMTKKSARARARSGTEKCPMCPNKRMLVEHHIHGREIGPDWDRWWNRAWICPSCHDDVHAGKVVIEGWVATTKGRELVFHKAGKPDEVFPAAKPNLYTGPQDEP